MGGGGLRISNEAADERRGVGDLCGTPDLIETANLKLRKVKVGPKNLRTGATTPSAVP